MRKRKNGIGGWIGSEGCETGQICWSAHWAILTSHNQDRRLIWRQLEVECSISDANGSQCRQVYSSFFGQLTHFQVKEWCTIQMLRPQQEVFSTWVSLLFRYSIGWTHQYQIGPEEIVTPFIQFTDLNDFQTLTVSNLPDGIVRKGVASNPDFLQSLTKPQMEITLSNTAGVIWLCEAISADHHSF